VILPNFDFGFLAQKKSLEVCLEQGWPTRIGLRPHLEKLSKIQNIEKSLNSDAEISSWAAGWPPLVWRLKKQFSD
jgi:hypothetical protein